MRLRSISEAVSDRERKMRTVIVACVVALVAAVSAQTPPDCAELDVGASEPLTGIPIIIPCIYYSTKLISLSLIIIILMTIFSNNFTRQFQLLPGFAVYVATLSS